MLIIAENGYCSASLRILLLNKVKMVDYEVTVFTANLATATTFNNVFIKLVGTDGESERKWLISLKGAASFMRAAVRPMFSFPTCRACFIDRAFMSLENRICGLHKLFDF